MHRIVIDAPQGTKMEVTFTQGAMDIALHLVRGHSIPVTLTFPIEVLRTAIGEIEARKSLLRGEVPDLAYLMPDLGVTAKTG